MKKIPVFISASAISLFLLAACGTPVRQSDEDSQAYTPAPWELLDEGESPAAAGASYTQTQTSDQTDSTALDSILALPDEASDSVLHTDLSRYRGLGSLAVAFNDSNKYQYAAGERIGIKPIVSIADAYFTRRPLHKIASCQWYTLEPLTHSMPYLVPEAAALIETIGRNFTDSLKKRNASGYKIRVTSVLRSAHSVKKLRRVNRNATDSSTHQLGTTFDISYARFDKTGISAVSLSDEELKYILAEVLRDLRMQNKCMVKFERKSPCFHITATGR